MSGRIEKGCKVDDVESLKRNKPTKAHCYIKQVNRDGTEVELARKDVMVNPNNGDILNTVDITADTDKHLKELDELAANRFAQRLKKPNEL